MDLSLIEMQATPSIDEIKILNELIIRFGYDISIMWCIIAAFNFGRMEGKRELRNERK